MAKIIFVGLTAAVCAIVLLMLGISNIEYNNSFFEGPCEMTLTEIFEPELDPGKPIFVELEQIIPTINYPKSTDPNVSVGCDESDIIAGYIKKKNFNLPKVVRDTIAKEVVSECENHKLPISLIIGIMKVESNFDPSAVSSVKARGIMQVFDKEINGKRVDTKRVHDIGYNIECGILILKNKLRHSKGSLDKALYLYVGRDDAYAGKVFRAMGEYIFYKSMSERNI